MNFPRTMALLALCIAVSACNIPDSTMANGRITLEGNVVTLHAEGAPDALIDANGTLQINGTAVSVTPAQHGLLMLYFQNVASVKQIGLEMGKVGASMGSTALKDAFDGKSKAERDQNAQSGGERLKALGQKICLAEVNIQSVQDQLTKQLPAFKPYGNIYTGKNAADCTKD